MKTNMFPGSRHRFYALEHEHSGLLPVFIWPSIWFETRQQGAEVRTTRITIALWRHRWHVCLGTHTPLPTAPLTDPMYGIEGFLSWAANWSQRTWLRSSFDRWLQGSEWKALVRLGGAKYHYTRIILAREYMAHEAHSSHPSSPSSVIPLDDMELDVTLTLTSGTAPPTQEADISRPRSPSP